MYLWEKNKFTSVSFNYFKNRQEISADQTWWADQWLKTTDLADAGLNTRLPKNQALGSSKEPKFYQNTKLFPLFARLLDNITYSLLAVCFTKT